MFYEDIPDLFTILGAIIITISGIFVISGLATKKIKKGQLIPFGPFLSISGFLIWLYGEDIFLKIIFR